MTHGSESENTVFTPLSRRPLVYELNRTSAASAAEPIA